jgi:hypothetical protein
MSAPLGRVGAILRRLPAGPVRGAEIGVYRGEMSAQLLAGRPDLYLLMVDSWASQAEQPEAYRATRDSHALLTATTQRTHFGRAVGATRFALQRREILHMRSEDAAALVEPGSLDFVFLDGDHSYEGTTADIAAWLPAVKPGGLLCGHDYCPGYGPDKQYDFRVIDAVDAAVARHGWTLDLDVDSCWFVRP